MASDPALPTMVTSARGTIPAWALYAAMAVLLGLYLGINSIISNGDVDTWKQLVWSLSSVAVIFFLAPFVVRFERRFPVDGRPRRLVFAAHAAAAIVFSALHIAGMTSLRKFAYAVVGQQYEFGRLATGVFYESQKDLITYVTILVVAFAIREYRARRSGELRASQLAADLSQARLKHLTAQVEPHFLFNTLNAISNRMHEDIDAADRMISDLGSLLRAAYDLDNHVLVPLEHELAWLRGYASLMTERFRGQLLFTLIVAPGLESLQVPRLLLQPLVENALTHGLRDGRGSLRVEVARRGSQLQYTISDDGIGIKEAAANPGTGLSNVTRRLDLLFPETHTFAMTAREPHGTVIKLSFPVLN